MKLSELIEVLHSVAARDPHALGAQVMLDHSEPGRRHLATVGTLVLDGPARVVVMFDVQVGPVKLPPPIPALTGPPVDTRSWLSFRRRSED